jgi:hypothetical protein
MTMVVNGDKILLPLLPLLCVANVGLMELFHVFKMRLHAAKVQWTRYKKCIPSTVLMRWSDEKSKNTADQGIIERNTFAKCEI